jgi:archaellum component FlaF (FlaF/FlaG flagellin family)
MSSSNAAAIRRRVGAQGVPAPAPTPGQTTSNMPRPQSGSATPSTPSQMTLQQVISTVDKRLSQLETIVQSNNDNNNNNTTNNESSDLPLVVDEFNNRFELIVTEINSLKDIVMKLQSYTMEVNKMLVDERIHILSDLGNNSVTSSNASSRVRATSPNSVDLKKMVEQELNNDH